MKRLILLVLLVLSVAALVVPATQASNAGVGSRMSCSPSANPNSDPCDPCEPPTAPAGVNATDPCEPPDPCTTTAPAGAHTDPCPPPTCPPTSPAGANSTDPCEPPDPCTTGSYGLGGDPCEPPDPCSLTTQGVNRESTNCPVVPTTPNTPPVEKGRDDGGISFNDADLGVVLYQTTDESGNAELAVYDMKNAGTNGAFMFSVTQEDLAPYFNNPPTENTLLKSGGHVSVYVLTTGEIQMNVGPDSEGKIFVKIFNGIPWTHVYGYTIDPQ